MEVEKPENLKALINLIIAQQVKELLGKHDDGEEDSEETMGSDAASEGMSKKQDIKEDKAESKAPKWADMLKGMK